MNRGTFAVVLAFGAIAACGEKANPGAPAATRSAAPSGSVPVPMTLCPSDSPDQCDRIGAALLDVDGLRAAYAFGVSCDGRGLGGARRAGCVEFKTRMAADKNDHGALLLATDGDDYPLPASDADLALHGRMTFEVATPSSAVATSVERTLRDHSRPFLECYRSARRRDESLSGTVRLDAWVDRVGGISMITPHAEAFDDNDAIQCVVRCLTKYSVSPAPQAVTELHASLTFVPAP